jgi:hypothetical protein
MSGETFAAIVGAVVGTVGGGLISLFLQIYGLRKAAKEKAHEVLDRQRALGIALIYKIGRIYSHLRVIRGNLEQSLKKGAAIGLSEKWQMLQPAIATLEHVHFSSDEMTLLLILGDHKLFNDMMAIDELHNMAIDVVKEYSRLREELTSMLPPVHKLEGLTGEVAFTAEQAGALRPRMAGLNNLIDGMVEYAERDEKAAWSIIERLQSLLRSQLGLPYTFDQKANILL